MDRRSFIRHSGVAATGLWLASAGRTRRVEANDEIVMAVVGFNGQGRVHFRDFSSIPGVRVKTICEIDERLFPQAQSLAQAVTGQNVELEVDYRKVLDDPDIDAVSIVTPNHWHSLMGVWACQAGKHAYVEKPISHNVWEGRQLVQAAAHYGRIVAHGTQARSFPHFQEAIRLLHEGVIGEVYMAKGLGFKPRDSIGRIPDSPVPPGVHFDLWLGPAAERPFNENLVHYNWHWFWEFGNGDLGNQGVHQVDLARWGLNKHDLPRYVHSVGGYFAFDSDQETPNTQIVTYRWDDGKIMQFEVRGLYTNAENDIRIGNLYYGTEGWMHLDQNGFRTYLGRNDQPGPQMSASGGKSARLLHRENFIEAVRQGKEDILTADALDGYLSSSLCHLGNIAYRLKRQVEFDSESERFVGDEVADGLLNRVYREPFVVPEMTSLPGNGQTLRFAHFGDGAGITSTLVLVNPWEEAVSGEVRLLATDGEGLDVELDGVELEGPTMEGGVAFTLPGLGVAYLRTPGTGALRAGWVEVNCPLPLGGTILFSGDFGTAGVGEVKPAARFLVPVEAKAAAGVRTGVALANPAGEAVEVSLLLRDRAGREAANGFLVVELPPRGQLARFVEELYQGMGVNLSDFDGTLEVEASRPIVGMAIRQSPGQFATLPVTPLP